VRRQLRRRSPPCDVRSVLAPLSARASGGIRSESFFVDLPKASMPARKRFQKFARPVPLARVAYRGRAVSFETSRNRRFDRSCCLPVAGLVLGLRNRPCLHVTSLRASCVYGGNGHGGFSRCLYDLHGRLGAVLESASPRVTAKAWGNSISALTQRERRNLSTAGTYLEVPATQHARSSQRGGDLTTRT